MSDLFQDKLHQCEAFASENGYIKQDRLRELARSVSCFQDFRLIVEFIANFGPSINSNYDELSLEVFINHFSYFMNSPGQKLLQNSVNQNNAYSQMSEFLLITVFATSEMES